MCHGFKFAKIRGIQFVTQSVVTSCFVNISIWLCVDCRKIHVLYVFLCPKLRRSQFAVGNWLFEQHLSNIFSGWLWMLLVWVETTKANIFDAPENTNGDLHPRKHQQLLQLYPAMHFASFCKIVFAGVSQCPI